MRRGLGCAAGGNPPQASSMALVDNLGFGCVALSAHPTAASALTMLETAFDLGLRHFDTAPAYGRGHSEKLLGALLKGRRAHVSVATKFAPWPHPNPRLPSALALPLNTARRALRR